MTGNIHSLANFTTVKNTVIKDVEDNVSELPDSDFSKNSVGVFDKYIMGRLVSFHFQILLT